MGFELWEQVDHIWLRLRAPCRGKVWHNKKQTNEAHLTWVLFFPGLSRLSPNFVFKYQFTVVFGHSFFYVKNSSKMIGKETPGYEPRDLSLNIDSITDTLWGPDTSLNFDFLTHKMRKFTELNLRPFWCSNSVNLRIAWRPASPSKMPRMMWSLDIRANKSLLNNDFAGRHGGSHKPPFVIFPVIIPQTL